MRAGGQAGLEDARVPGGVLGRRDRVSAGHVRAGVKGGGGVERQQGRRSSAGQEG